MLFTLVYRNPSFRETVRYSLQGVSLMPIFYFAVSRAGHPLFRWLNWPFVERVGLYSYSIYLVHHVIASVIRNISPSLSNPVSLLATTSVASLAFSHVVYRYVEVPFARMRRRLRD